MSFYIAHLENLLALKTDAPQVEGERQRLRACQTSRTIAIPERVVTDGAVRPLHQIVREFNPPVHVRDMIACDMARWRAGDPCFYPRHKP